MKKTLLTVVVAALLLVSLVLPAFADGEEPEAPTAYYWQTAYTTATINIDGECDDEYYKSEKILVDDSEGYYNRPGYDAVWENGNGEFFAYTLAGPTGLYVYVEIKDDTMRNPDEMDSRGDTGDGCQLYFDWVPNDDAHDNIDPWDDGAIKNYKNTYVGYTGMCYLGWIHSDFAGNICTNGAFALEGLGDDGDQEVEYACKILEDGWSAEYYIPWRDDDMVNDVQNKVYVNCGFGIQVCDDADVDDAVNVGEENTRITFDQPQGRGLSYWYDYGLLSQLIITYDGVPAEGAPGADLPENPETADAIVAVVAALAVAGAGLIVFGKKAK